MIVIKKILAVVFVSIVPSLLILSVPPVPVPKGDKR